MDTGDPKCCTDCLHIKGEHECCPKDEKEILLADCMLVFVLELRDCRMPFFLHLREAHDIQTLQGVCAVWRIDEHNNVVQYAKLEELE